MQPAPTSVPEASENPSATAAADGGPFQAPVQAPVPRGCSNLKLRQADRVVSRHYDRYLATAGLKTSQYAMLGHIAALMPVQPAELAAQLQMEPSTLTRNLQPLVAQGWVVVGPGRNGRSRQVSLTEAGRAKHAEAKTAWRQAQQGFNERLGTQRVAQLHGLLDECLRLMTEAGVDAEADGSP